MSISINFLDFPYLSSESIQLSIDKKLIAYKKQKITIVATFALGCLNLSLFVLVGGFSATVAPVGLTIFAISLIASLVFVSHVRSIFANWDKQRASNAFKLEVMEEFYSKAPSYKSCYWLLHNKEGIEFLKKVYHKEASSEQHYEALKQLFSVAMMCEKFEIAPLFWEKLTLTDQKEFSVEYYDEIFLFLNKYDFRSMAECVFFHDCNYFENSETGKKILNFLLTDVHHYILNGLPIKLLPDEENKIEKKQLIVE